MPFAWLPEAAGVVTSALLLVALAILLTTFDDKVIFDWKGVTLNAVVSVISTASKAALLYAMSELISQWKWILFTRTSRPLLDFERIDAASRGPMGSLTLMWRQNSIGFLRLGSLVVMLSIAADPFTQQLIQYKQRVVYTQDASTTVNRAGRFAKGTELIAGSPTATSSVGADFSIKSAIMYGLAKPMHNVVQQGTFVCPTGNCTWPSFESLAVCNKCTNIDGKFERLATDSSQFGFANSNNNRGSSNNSYIGTAFRLPNGLYLDNEDGNTYGGPAFILMATFGSTNASETITAQGMDTLIWSMSVIRAEPDLNSSAVWPNLPLSAMECVHFYCVNNYETTVTNGSLLEISRQVADATRVRASWQPEATDAACQMTDSNLGSIAFDTLSSACPRTDLVLSSPATSTRFNISKAAVDSISSYYKSTFAGTTSEVNITGPDRDTPPVSGRYNGYYLNATTQIQYEEIRYSPEAIQPLLSSKDLNETFTSLAVSMSNAIRSGADETSDGVSRIVTGSKGEVTTFYRIVWPWISLHCFIVIVGIVFLGLTMWENQRHGLAVPLWRSSGLAIASQGDAVTSVLSGMQTLDEIWKKARVSRVTFIDKNDGVRSSLEHLELDPLETATQSP